MIAFVCSSGFEDALRAEVGAASEVVCPGVVVARDDRPLDATDHVFARQVLPGAAFVRAPSIAALAQGALDEVLPELRRAVGPWRLDAFVADNPDDPHQPGELARRVTLVRDTFLRRLKEARRRAARARVDADGDVLRVQLLLVERDCLIVSATQPANLPCGAPWPAPFSGGRVVVANDWAAPSSAFRKLEEALAWLGEPIRADETCVDLGAAPGGWSHVALKLGARVVAVDRAALAPRIACHQRLSHVRRDAFTYVPESRPVDWLLCDVIADPSKSLGLLERWVRERWCRRLVFHLKFKGRDRYALGREAARAVRDAGFPCVRVKHLFFDRNEVTVMARAEKVSINRMPSAGGAVATTRFAG